MNAIRGSVAQIAHSHPGLAQFALLVHRYTVGLNVISIDRRSHLLIGSAVLRGCRIKIVGESNRLIIADASRLTGASIRILGTHNLVTLDERVVFDHAHALIEGAGNSLAIGSNTQVRPRTNLVVNGGAQISIGRNSAVSTDVEFRAGDSHTVVDMDGRHLNQSKDISLGDHVWVGTRTIMLKGTSIAADSIVGAGSLVTGDFEEGNVIIAGHPARVVRRGVNWLR